jgi:hypothetical protein
MDRMSDGLYIAISISRLQIMCIISKERIEFAHMSKEHKERFSQLHPSHGTPEARAYPMNSFRCMGTGGHNAMVIIQKKRPTKPEETVKQ